MNREQEKAAAQLIGAFIGDGFMNKYQRNPVIEFSGDKTLDKEHFTHTIIPLMKMLFPHIAPTEIEKKTCHGRAIRYYDHEISHFLMDYGFSYGPKSHTVQIPTEFIVDEELLFLVLRGLFDTDGCVYLDQRARYKRPYPRISLMTVSRPLFGQLINLLEPYFSLYLNAIPSRGAYVVETYGYKNLDNWMKTIGFSNPRHLHKIQQIMPL